MAGLSAAHMLMEPPYFSFAFIYISGAAYIMAHTYIKKHEILV